VAYRVIDEVGWCGMCVISVPGLHECVAFFYVTAEVPWFGNGNGMGFSVLCGLLWRLAELLCFGLFRRRGGRFVQLCVCVSFMIISPSLRLGIGLVGFGVLERCVTVWGGIVWDAQLQIVDSADCGVWVRLVFYHKIYRGLVIQYKLAAFCRIISLMVDAGDRRHYLVLARAYFFSSWSLHWQRG